MEHEMIMEGCEIPVYFGTVFSFLLLLIMLHVQGIGENAASVIGREFTIRIVAFGAVGDLSIGFSKRDRRGKVGTVGH